MNAINYKTTITACISAAASFVLFSQQLHLLAYPSWLLAVAMFAQVGGLLAFGITAKDYNATGGTVAITPEAEKRVEADPKP